MRILPRVPNLKGLIVEHCRNCAELREENKRLRELNEKLSNSLSGEIARPHNTEMILGAALSGGDALGLAKQLIEGREKK